MVGLDLSGVRRFLEEEILVDTVLVERDNGTADAVLDTTSGELVEPPPTTIYDGAGAILPLGGFSSVPDPDGQRVAQETGAQYRFLAPLGADIPARAGDQVRVTAQGAADADPELMGRRFQVVEFGTVSTVGVVRTIYLKQE